MRDNDMSEDIHETAARWHAAQVHDDMDWDAFTAWLEADPRHRHAFDDIALLDERIDAHRDTLRTLVTERPAVPASSRWRVGRWAAAAAIVVGTGIGVAEWQARDDIPTTIAYRAGTAAKDVDLGPGIRASLAPGSELIADARVPTRLSLSGRAIFDIAHDPRRAVMVQAQGYEIRDVGTKFEVVSGSGIVNVAVAEGRVAVRAKDKSVETIVSAGRSLTGQSDGSFILGAARPETIGGWRRGSLVYDQLPLALVADDIARLTGRSIIVDPAAAKRPFSGVLATGGGDEMVRSLEMLADLQARRDGDTIRLGDRVRR